MATDRTEQAILEELAALCVSPGYIHAIAFLSYRDNVVAIGDELEPADLINLHTRERLVRTEISTLLGLMVKKAVDFSLPSQDDLGAYISKTEALLEELHDSMNAALRFDATRLGDPTYEPMKEGSAIREAIFYGAESAYTFQYRDLAEKRYRDDTTWIVSNRGFAMADACAVARALVEFCNANLMNDLKALKNKPTAEWTMLPAFTVTPAEIANTGGLDQATVRRVLEAFSLPAGSTNAAFKALQDYNETNAFPIIAMGQDRYVLLQYYAFTEALYESPFFWMLEDKSYRQTASKHRGEFTEKFSAECLRRAFGADAVYLSVDILKGADTIGEIDVLALFGGRALVLQAKSKRLTLAARKGNDLQIRDDFKKAIQDSYDQALKCSEALLRRDLVFKDCSGRIVPIPSSIKQIFPMCIVADHYPALAFQAREFLQMTTTDVIAPPLVTDVFALDAMSEMLATPLHFLNYMSLRARFGDSLLASHEFTLLSYHLKRNLWLEPDFNVMMLSDDISVDLDVAMAVRRDGISGARTPEGILTRFSGTELGTVLTGIERRSELSTTDFGLFVLQVNDRGIEQMNDGIAAMKHRAAKYNVLSDMSILFGNTDAGVTIHCHPDLNPTAASRLRAHCEMRKYAERAQQWFGLGLSATSSIFFHGVSLDGPWIQDDKRDAVVSSLPKGEKLPLTGVAAKLRRKVGRNDPCPCGSKQKHKKCCGRR